MRDQAVFFDGVLYARGGALAELSMCWYASGVATSVSMARVAAMASGFPLKVPTIS